MAFPVEIAGKYWTQFNFFSIPNGQENFSVGRQSYQTFFHSCSCNQTDKWKYTL